jgi:hypothetical protein
VESQSREVEDGAHVSAAFNVRKLASGDQWAPLVRYPAPRSLTTLPTLLLVVNRRQSNRLEDCKVEDEAGPIESNDSEYSQL